MKKMKKHPMNDELILNNRANHTGMVKQNDCVECNEELLFAMRDRHHTFSLGLRTVLQCLRLAEEEGNIPSLPPDWWNSVANRHGAFFLTDYQKE